MYLLKHKSPLQSNDGFNVVIARNKSTYTDQRIEEIKKKYDDSHHNYHSHQVPAASIDKSDKENQDYAKDSSKKAKSGKQVKQAEIYSNRNKPKPKEIEKQKEIMLSCPDNNSKQTKIHHKIRPFDLIENNFIKSTINEKLNTNESDPFFQKLSIKQAADQNYFKSKDSYSKILKKQCNDPRINSIEKINSKIKRILDCIDSCQKQEENHNVELKRHSQMSRSILGKSIVQTNGYKPQQFNSIQQARLVPAQKSYFEKAQNKQQRRSQQEENIRKSNSQSQRGHNNFSQYLTSYKNMLDGKKEEFTNDLTLQKQRKQTRYVSCYAKFKKQEIRAPQQNDMMGSKVEQINKQIQKFYDKINELQERKRTLNIKFKPFQLQASPTHKINADSRITEIKKRQQHQKADQQHQQKPKNDFFRQIVVIGETPEKKNIYEYSHNENKGLKSQESVDNKRFQHSRRVSFEHARVESFVENSPIRNASSIPKIQEDLRAYNNEELRRKIEERIQQRRKRMQSLHEDIKKKTNTQQTIQLVKALCQQVKLDEQLRNSKNWFNQCNHFEKTNILKARLKEKGISLNEWEIKKTFFEISEDETDPFFSFREEKYTIQSLIEYYIQSNNFWRQNLAKRWNIASMINLQNFLHHFHDKNDIVIEDIVRLLNTQSGNFYRNRDVHMIFERMRQNFNKNMRPNVTIEDIQSILQKDS